MTFKLNRLSDVLWEIPAAGAMRVPVHLYTSRAMLPRVTADNAPQQAANVAQLPGIVTASLAMPDIHWGYGFPIGGVAAFDVDSGIVSPGGVGYDINCGVRLMASDLTADEVRRHLDPLTTALFNNIPSGVGASGSLHAGRRDLERIAVQGAGWAVSQGFGTPDDLEYIEANGAFRDAGPEAVSDRAWARAADQVGTLGSGNHFLEIAEVTRLFDVKAAEVLGLAEGRAVVTIHCGSRGFGHQVCDDYLRVMDRAVRKHGIALPDRQLACAPVHSKEGQAYLRAMRCAVNFAFANRQVIAQGVRDAFQHVMGESPLRTVYEVAHNVARIETHNVAGDMQAVCVHRKGATRAFGPHHPDIPQAYRAIGQPVLVPGDMGRCSYVLLGTDGAMQHTFGSTCHGAGRLMSRKKAIKSARGRDIRDELNRRGIVVRARDRRTLAEEMPDAYKDVSDVVDVCEKAGISRRVARLEPLGCIKG